MSDQDSGADGLRDGGRGRAGCEKPVAGRDVRGRTRGVGTKRRKGLRDGAVRDRGPADRPRLRRILPLAPPR
ncbi:hypothetical protein F750_2500 [Streptomyces sp. PAMC 26508]|nr:hypothetical protein F750_2500 [Streptomyces sp. PAMC 26508]